MLRDNELFAAIHRREYFSRFQKGQHPRVTVVACSDSRFHMHVLDRTPDDDIFVIRNIGNNVDATSGSVEYGLRHLHTPMLLIVGHVRCGAVKAAMGDYASVGSVVRRELDSLHLSIFRTGAGGTFAQRWLANVIGNVHQQVQYALSEYADLVSAGTLYVVGAVYDFRNDLGRGMGRLHLINLNGEKNGARIHASRLVTAAKRVWKELRTANPGRH